MQTKPTFAEIASDYQLWMQYADPIGLDSLQDFEAKSTEEKIAFLKACCGEEQESAE